MRVVEVEFAEMNHVLEIREGIVGHIEIGHLQHHGRGDALQNRVIVSIPAGKGNVHFAVHHGLTLSQLKKMLLIEVDPMG